MVQLWPYSRDSNRKMANQSVSIGFIFLLVGLQIMEVSAIRNTPTSSKSLSDDVILSASSFHLDKTWSKEKNDKSMSEFETTHPTLQLQSSRSVERLDKIDTDSLKFTSLHSGLDAVATASKHVDDIDGNNIEVKPAEYLNVKSTSEIEQSGEGQGAPQGLTLSEPLYPTGSNQQRQGRQEVPRIYSERALPSNMQTATVGNRQANPDIQDIITGIVKLLNGNVNVAANTIRPHKPVQATRINNRGPPRISDLPPLPPDFDTPEMNPPPLPEQPYPFDKPPAPEKPSINQLPPIQERPTPPKPYINGVSVTEAGAPVNRPWNRPYRPSNRRPIPPYKPLPSHEMDNFNKNENKNDNKPTQVSTSTDQSNENLTSPEQTPEETATKKPLKYQPPLKQNQIMSENTLVLGSDVQPIPIPTQPEHSIKPVAPSDSHESSKSSLTPQEASSETKSAEIESTTRNIMRTTLKIETSSSIQVIEPTKTIIEVQPAIVPLENNSEASNKLSPVISDTMTIIEPSKASESSYSGNYHISTPTEGLPTSTTSKSSGLFETMTQHPTSTTFYKNPASINHYNYRPRPGIVLDDTLDYTKAPGLVTQRPYAPPRHPPLGDIFDVTVSAIQGPGGASGESVRVSVNPTGGHDVILTSAVEGQGFVSIDGKRTYLNLFDNSDENIVATKTHIQPTRIQGPIIGTGYAVPQVDTSSITSRPNGLPRRPTFHRRPTQPPVRIDTCIVGDLSTCDASQHEACATIQGVSACHCKPGYARLVHSLPCKKVVSIVVSIRIDRIYDWKVTWSHDLADRESEAYQTIAYESNKAIESAMSMTPFSDEYMGSLINSVYQGDVSKGQGGVFVNATLKLTHESRTARPSLAGELQRHLLGVIHRRNNNIGNSAVFVDTPVGSISSLQDLDECASSELNDCNSSAICTNNWGGFTCHCKPGLKDPHKDDPLLAGRTCISCASSHCNNRGSCSYQGNAMQCSRRWSREQNVMGSPVYGYVPGGISAVGSAGTIASVKQGPPSALPPYLWGHITEHMATANLYATEPMGPTRSNSAGFRYPTMSCHSTLPPVPLPRLQAPPHPRQRSQLDPDSSDSELQDRDRADLIPQSNGFHVPRPRSRSSLANQSGIYYDVEYDQGDSHHLSQNNIPMSTYSMAPYYRT
ncbi:uncharacterized protein pwn isoform X2 [Chelonus insularis]|uniref:uncharacterized protein pwn isoform X2 n=1 Tax=Chelonus insularis TaxID=460826 RepID=UPI00158DCD19|nr:uncharacterized protein LOC118067571 isoform X2 [Chelonus insularis]